MKISHTIKVLVTSDFLMNTGFSIFAPVFAVFVTKQITSGTVEVVGFAAAITQVVKSILQIPVARYLDRNHGEFDDFYSMITGTALMALIPFMYLFATRPLHLYIIQAIYGLGLALAVPPWYAIFTRHVDKMKENVEWSLESIAIGLGGGAAAALSGVVVANFGFRSAFIFGGLFAVLGALMQVRIYRDLRAHVGHGQVEPLPDKAG